MGIPKSVFAAAACAALFFAAGAAHAQRVDALYILEDLNDPDGNVAGLRIVGTAAGVEGFVEGTGTAGDVVRIGYITDTPTDVNADDKQARVRQSDFSRINFFIASAVDARDLDLNVTPRKCSIDAKAQVDKEKGQVTVKCSGDDLFADVTADELASIQAAFLDNKQVKIKVKSDGSKGSITITLKGTATEAIKS